MKRPFCAAAGILALALAGCSGLGEAIRDDPVATAAFESGELIDVLSPEAIPAVERPRFESPERAAEHLDATSPVAVLVIGGRARAYPLAVLVWHEIVNDSIEGEAVAVTYAPLSGAVMAFRRSVDGRVLTFGSSGKLYRANLVMYDRETRTIWPQMSGRAALGPLSGTNLDLVPVQVCSFDDFRSSFPGGEVLTAETGAARVYGTTPYAGYDSRSRPSQAFFARRPDPRLEPMQRVVGVVSGGEARAYPFPWLRAQEVLYDRLGGREVVVLWRAGTRSPLDTPLIADGTDVGSAGVFVPTIDGQRVELRPAEDGFRDEETGSTWTVLGVATGGPLAGRRLEPVLQTEAFWFAWAAFHPSTTVFEAP